MGRIEGFWVRNYRTLRQIGIGSCFKQFAYIENDEVFHPFELGPVTLFAGANGTGKSTIFDVFTFLSDIFRYGVEKACLKRGGFESLYSREAIGPVSIGINYRLEGEEEPATYAIGIAQDKAGKPFIETELLAYRNGPQPFPVLYLQNGGKSIRYIAPDASLSGAELNKIEFTDFRHLGLAQLEEHPAYPVFQVVRKLIETWYLSDFSMDIPKGLSRAATARYMNPRGTTLQDLMRFMTETYGDRLPEILQRLQPFLPNAESIQFEVDAEGRTTLYFSQQRLIIPATQMSSGILRLFTYLLLLEEPQPAPLICLEEPENGLDRIACWRFIDALTRYMERVSTPKKTAAGQSPNESPESNLSSQLFVATHHPGIADSLKPQDVWVFETDKEGFAVVNRACDDLVIENLLKQNELPPSWFSDHFDSKL